MENGWIKIATYSSELDSEMAKLLLEQHDIRTVMLNKQDSSFKFGKIELFVQDENFAEATAIMAANDTNKVDED
ncbi:putative signal transducing protein [Sphingobacterium griseoflavum]|uniref:DUF2007 domain-containing protein n=1 Tax=Sphingobacterium griseoflavum TaxID=1474952 RepID=A0ABQ3HS43_9SPHI|nr:DUF2007 domain-containing protein [Sphingobacterium griseoflavum]GHE29516.1 hypothetical protein GCM10017764_10540 [Sphingobacterium griseoflavum]